MMLITLLCTLFIQIIYSEIITNGFDCSSVASKTVGVTNKDCSKWCENNVKDKLDENCIKVKVALDSSGDLGANFCYDGWIVGHTLDSKDIDKSYVALKDVAGVKTPQECQFICQQTQNCLNFQWKPPIEDVPNCALKSNNQLVYAKVDSKRKTFSPDYCNEKETIACLKAKKCRFDNACIWCSKKWLSGPSICSAVYSLKRLSSNTFTCTYDGKHPDEEIPNPITYQMDDMRNRLLLEAGSTNANTGSMAENSSEIPNIENSAYQMADDMKSSATITTAVASGSVILLVGAGGAGGYYLYKRRKSRSRMSDDLSDADTEEVPIESQIDEYL